MSNSQTITCKAAVCWGLGEASKVEEIQVEPPKSSEVRVKMLYASLCHTDILCSEGFPMPLFPRVLGHEGVGVVESVGDEVKEVKEGDIVIPTYIGECAECENCKSGVTNLCLKYQLSMTGLMLDGTSRMSINGQILYQTFSYSTWSEYMVTDANYVVKVDPTMDLSHATFLSCGFTTGFGAAWKDFKVVQGSTVAVLGLGAVGLGAIDGATLQGAAKIIGIDNNPCKKEKGEAFGMTDFINPHESNKSIPELVKDLTHGMGVDYIFECTGVPSLLSQALEATKLGKGKMMVIGIGVDPEVPLNVISLACGGRTMKGTIFGGIKTKTDLPILLEKCKNRELKLDHLVTHHVKLEEIGKASQLLKQPDCVKVLIHI